MTPSPTPLAPGRHRDWLPPAGVRYVVCDVDGTLVGSDVLARPAVVEAVARAQDAGVRVGYATGRMRDAMAVLHDQLGAQGPHLLHNGAEVRAAGHTIAAWPLPDGAVRELLALVARRDDAYLEVYTESGYLASSLDERAAPHWELVGAPPRGVVTHADELDGTDVLKATFTAFDPAAVADLVDASEALGLSAGSASSPRTPHLAYVNVTHPDADKGRALVHAAGHLDVPLSQVVAIGDAANDLSMFAVAGTAIAMGQADVRVRDAAHLVAPPVDDDGVVAALDAIAGWQTR